MAALTWMEGPKALRLACLVPAMQDRCGGIFSSRDTASTISSKMTLTPKHLFRAIVSLGEVDAQPATKLLPVTGWMLQMVRPPVALSLLALAGVCRR